MLSKATILKTKLQSIRSVLEKTPSSEKKGHITIPLANSFNGLVSEAGEAYPELVDHLPPTIEATLDVAYMGSADITYLDLEIYVEQVISLLDLVERSPKPL